MNGGWQAGQHPVEVLQTLKAFFFVAVQVAYAALPNYEERGEEFAAEAVLLRRKFTEEGERQCRLTLLVRLR